VTRRETTDLRSLLDGTSQQARTLAALDPQAVPIDGRSDADLIAFVQKLTRHLIFTPGEAHWDALATPSPFSGLALSPADMAAYIDDPERFTVEAARWLARPHFALLLTCVALLRHLRDQQNGIVRRHLDHFYRDQLGMTPLPARPAGSPGAEFPAPSSAMTSGSGLLAGLAIVAWIVARRPS
jgi:hypothetical protein